MRVSRRELASAILFGAPMLAFGHAASAQTPSGLSEQLMPHPAPALPRPAAPAPAAGGAPSLPAGVTIKETPTATIMSVQGDVLFDFDSAQLRPSSREVLARVVAYINERRPPQIAVEGNTDSVGSPDYNVALGRNRARSVVGFFVQSGLPGGIFTVASYGATHPVAANTNPDGSDNPEGRAHNRRVDIILER